MFRYHHISGLVLAAAAMAVGLPTAAAIGPELYISSTGDAVIAGIELVDKNALNLFSVIVWGQRWAIPIDQFTVVESADGKRIALEEILIGHRLEIRGRVSAKPGWLDVRLIRDLSIGTPAPAAVPQPAAVFQALTPPVASAPEPPKPAVIESPPPAESKPTPAKTSPAPEKIKSKASTSTSTERILNDNLRAGMRGRQVAILQEFLQKNGWGIPNDGPVTGYYGRTTIQAVKKFQAANGLTPEGEVGPKTRALINEFLKSKRP